MSHKYLDYIRQENKRISSICSICSKPSTDIIAIDHQIKFVCKTHFILEQEKRASTQVSFE